MTRKLYLEPAAVTYPDGTKFHSDAAMQQAIDDIMLLRAALKPFADSELLDKDEEHMDPATRVLSWCSITVGDVVLARKIVNEQSTRGSWWHCNKCHTSHGPEVDYTQDGLGLRQCLDR